MIVCACQATCAAAISHAKKIDPENRNSGRVCSRHIPVSRPTAREKTDILDRTPALHPRRTEANRLRVTPPRDTTGGMHPGNGWVSAGGVWCCCAAVLGGSFSLSPSDKSILGVIVPAPGLTCPERAELQPRVTPRCGFTLGCEGALSGLLAGRAQPLWSYPGNNGGDSCESRRNQAMILRYLARRFSKSFEPSSFSRQASYSS